MNIFVLTIFSVYFVIEQEWMTLITERTACYLSGLSEGQIVRVVIFLFAKIEYWNGGQFQLRSFYSVP